MLFNTPCLEWVLSHALDCIGKLIKSKEVYFLFVAHIFFSAINLWSSKFWHYLFRKSSISLSSRGIFTILKDKYFSLAFWKCFAYRTLIRNNIKTLLCALSHSCCWGEDHYFFIAYNAWCAFWQIEGKERIFSCRSFGNLDHPPSSSRWTVNYDTSCLKGTHNL